MTSKYYGWTMYLGSRPYKAALSWQERMLRYRLQGSVRDTLFYMTHPDVITIGRDFDEKAIECAGDIEVHRVTRGGGVTYHGPGQLIAYPVFDLRRRGGDLHRFVRNLEEGIIRAFDTYGLTCRRHDEHTGVWVEDRKIASIGVAVQQWVSFHGIAVNLTTDLQKFHQIHPCGLSPDVMTSAQRELKREISTEEFAERLTAAYGDVFETAFTEVDMEEMAEIISLDESTQTL